MNEIFNNNPNNPSDFDPNRPRLKKVKRPIKKIVEGQAGAPIPPRPQNTQFIQPRPPMPEEEDAFNLDSYLDETDNLPVLTQSRNIPENKAPQFIGEEDYAEDIRPTKNTNNKLQKFLTPKALISITIGAFFLGFIISKVLFGEQKVVRDGLQGVVINTEVPRGRARCGVAEKTQGCVLYIMNPQRQELNARDFYDLASQLTGRQRFVIETGNMRYSNVKIRPGDIAQFNIPPLQ